MKSFITIFIILITCTLTISQCVDNIIVNGTFEADSTGYRITGAGWGSFLDPDLHSIISEIPVEQWEWKGELEDSRQGGNWQNIYGAELISQRVELEIGLRYVLSLEYASQPIFSDISNNRTDDTSRVTVLFDDIIEYQTPYATTPYSWEQACYSFIATSSELTIKFKNLSNSYTALDDICLVVDENNIALPSSYEVCLGEELEIDFSDLSNYEILWSTGSNGNSIVIEEEGEYWVDFIGACGTLRETFDVVVEDCGCKLYIPNIFNPSLDGLNQTFKIGTSCPLEYYNLSIFDRWGSELFRSNNIEVSWDGTYLNQNVNPGNYSFVVEYQLADSLKYSKGIVVLMR